MMKICTDTSSDAMKFTPTPGTLARSAMTFLAVKRAHTMATTPMRTAATVVVTTA